MKYDDASWHYGGQFPKDLPEIAGATHIGMFVSWMVLHGFSSEELLEDVPEEIAKLQKREITGAVFLMTALDEKFSDQDLNDEGNAFALAYYQGEDNDSLYITDYFLAFGVDEGSCYGVEDNWPNFEKLAVLVSRRFEEWRSEGRPKYMRQAISGE